MKKLYISPLIREMEAETEDLMEISLVRDSEDVADEDALSREYDPWNTNKKVWEE
jgi:hypothetical protein